MEGSLILSTPDGQQHFQAERTNLQAGAPLVKCNANAWSHPVQTTGQCGCNQVVRYGAISHGAGEYEISVLAVCTASAFGWFLPVVKGHNRVEEVINGQHHASTGEDIAIIMNHPCQDQV
jgi:hypothetical protein